MHTNAHLSNMQNLDRAANALKRQFTSNSQGSLPASLAMGDSMDVDDIINNLRVTSPTSSAKIGDSELHEDASSLKRAWINERFAPELLLFEHDLLRRIMTRIYQKVWCFSDVACREFGCVCK
jgi:hypothetical protein